MGCLKSLTLALSATILVLAILAQVSPDLRQKVCTLPLFIAWTWTDVGDQIGGFFLDCVRSATIEMMKRDLPEKKMDDFESGPGVIPADEFTWEKFLEVSEDMTRITLIPGLIKDVPCTNWDVKYFQDRLETKNKFNETFGDLKIGFQRLLQTDRLSSLKAPQRRDEFATVREVMGMFERHEPIFISFEYQMFNRFPSFKK